MPSHFSHEMLGVAQVGGDSNKVMFGKHTVHDIVICS